MEDLEKAKEIVQNFIEEMNSWEINSEKIDNDEDDGLSWEEKEELVAQNVSLIMEKYCTPKIRKMSSPDSISRGLEGSYNYDPKEEKVCNATLEKKDAIFVVTEKDIKYHRYTLLKKNDSWLIDSKKSQYKGEDNWQADYL